MMAINKKEIPHEKPIIPPETRILSHTACGLLTGAFCAGLFNPWDKALYLSVKNHRPFLSAENFSRPFQGVMQAISQRAFAWGSYYIAQGEIKSHLYPYLCQELNWSEGNTQIMIGMAAGSISGMINNPLSVIKYHTWGQSDRKFVSSVKDHWQKSGMTFFKKGLNATLARDISFGIFYEYLRYAVYNHGKKIVCNKNPSDYTLHCLKFSSDMMAAGLATVVSSPFNYARNMHYATPIEQKPSSIVNTLMNLHAEHAHLPLVSRINIFRESLRIGWGTLRVASGMAVGQLVFDQLSKNIANKK